MRRKMFLAFLLAVASAALAPTPSQARQKIVCSASCLKGSCWCVLCSCGCTESDHPWCGGQEASVSHAHANSLTVVRPLEGDGGDGGDGGGPGDIDFSTVSIARAAGHGEITAGDDGSFLYLPERDFTGLDSFTFKVCNFSGDCDLGTVLIDVVPDEK